MRKHIFILFYCFLLSIPFYSAAQNDINHAPSKNEVGISLLSIKSNDGLAYAADYYVSVFNGLSYSRHFGRHALRVGGEFRNSQQVGIGDFVGKSTYSEDKFNLGYQCTFLEKAVKPYVAVDMIYMVAKAYSDFLGGFAGIYSEVELKKQGIGYAPALGLYFRLVGSLSISWEGNVEFLWINEKGTNIRSDPHDFQMRTTYPINRNDHIWLLNPVKCISLNYGF